MTAAAVVSSEALGCTFRKLQLSEQYFRRELLPLVEVSSPRVSQCRPADRDGDERLSLSRLAEPSLALAPGCLSPVGSLQSEIGGSRLSESAMLLLPAAAFAFLLKGSEGGGLSCRLPPPFRKRQAS